jgi:hypothetical protein
MNHELPKGPEVNRRTIIRGMAALLSPINSPLLSVKQPLELAEQAVGASQLIKGIFKIKELGRIFRTANRALPGGVYCWGFNDIKCEDGVKRFFTNVFPSYGEQQYDLIRGVVADREKNATAALDTLLQTVESFLKCPAIRQALEETKPDCGWIHQRARLWYQGKANSLISEREKAGDLNEDAARQLLLTIEQLPCPDTHLAFSDARWQKIISKFYQVQKRSREKSDTAADPDDSIADRIEREFQARLSEDIAAVEERFLSRLGFSPEASRRYRELFEREDQTLLSFLMGQVSSPFFSPLCFEEWLDIQPEKQALPRLTKPLNFLSSFKDRQEFRELVVAGWARNKMMINQVISGNTLAALLGKSPIAQPRKAASQSVEDPFDRKAPEKPLLMEEQVLSEGTGYIALRLPSFLNPQELDLRPAEFIRTRLNISGHLNEIKASGSIIPAAETEISFQSFLPIRKPETADPGSWLIRVFPRDSMADVTIMEGDDGLTTISLAPGDHLYVLLTDTRVVSVTSGTPAECILDNKFFYFEQPLPK